LQKLPTDDCIAGVNTDWEDTATVIFSGVLHNPESTRTDPGLLTRTDPWTDKIVK